jgi:non-ribosomal peptide synthetase component F
MLALLTGQTDVVYEHLVAGRNSAIPQIEDVVGCCLNLIPVRVNLTNAQSPAELLCAVQEQFLALGEADSLGGKDIIEHCTDWPAGSSLESTVQHESNDEGRDVQVAGGPLEAGYFKNPHSVPTGIYMFSIVRGDQLCFELATNTHVMSEKTANAIVNGLVRLVDQLDACIDGPLAAWTQSVDVSD